MPYIEPVKRASFGPALDLLKTRIEYDGITPGDLNYLITMIVHMYVEDKGLSYTFLNDVVGVLESAKAEFQRRVVVPYEDRKIQENGDV